MLSSKSEKRGKNLCHCHQHRLRSFKSWLFNLINFGIVFQAAISCVGSLCAKFGWKEYKMVLMYFLNCKPTEPAHQKQRVKVLAAILNSFHFISVEGEDKKSELNVFSFLLINFINVSIDRSDLNSTFILLTTVSSYFFFDTTVFFSFIADEAANISATKIVNTLLHKMRLQRDDDEVDCALYVPILKILMLYPKKLKSNISTLLAQTSVCYWFFLQMYLWCVGVSVLDLYYCLPRFLNCSLSHFL